MSSFHSSPLLSAEGICKTYKTRTVVDQVSLKVGHGEIVGLLGPNGAGKTTSFYMVAGLVRPDEGRVIFADEPTGNLDSITSKQVLYRMLQISKQMGTTFVMVTHEPELASCADRIITILDGKVQSDVVQDPATRERNREALFASLEGNMRIGGDSASGEVHQKTAAELASYAAPAAAAQQPEQPKP